MARKLEFEATETLREQPQPSFAPPPRPPRRSSSRTQKTRPDSPCAQRSNLQEAAWDGKKARNSRPNSPRSRPDDWRKKKEAPWNILPDLGDGAVVLGDAAVAWASQREEVKLAKCEIGYRAAGYVAGPETEKMIRYGVQAGELARKGAECCPKIPFVSPCVKDCAKYCKGWAEDHATAVVSKQFGAPVGAAVNTAAFGRIGTTDPTDASKLVTTRTDEVVGGLLHGAGIVKDDMLVDAVGAAGAGVVTGGLGRVAGKNIGRLAARNCGAKTRARSEGAGGYAGSAATCAIVGGMAAGPLGAAAGAAAGVGKKALSDCRTYTWHSAKFQLGLTKLLPRFMGGVTSDMVFEWRITECKWSGCQENRQEAKSCKWSGIPAGSSYPKANRSSSVPVRQSAEKQFQASQDDDQQTTMNLEEAGIIKMENGLAEFNVRCDYVFSVETYKNVSVQFWTADGVEHDSIHCMNARTHWRRYSARTKADAKITRVIATLL